MITVRVNGREYGNFINASAHLSLTALAHSFSLRSTVTKANVFPILAGDRVELLADGIKVLTGYADRLNVSYDASQHMIDVSGRGLLCDLIDSSVKSTYEFLSQVTLENVATTVLHDLGLSVKIINNAGQIDPFESEDITSSGVGGNAFQFIESFARKRQVLLTSDANGNLVFTRGDSTTKAPMELRNIIGGQSNNIKSAQMSIDLSQAYGEYRVKSQLNPTFLESGVSADDISDQGGTARDSRIRASRFLEIVSEESADSDVSGDRAIWEANFRRSQSIKYTATVQGHTVNGVPWGVNTLVTISDNFCNLQATMRISEVELVYGLDTGSETILTMVTQNAFTLQAEQTTREMAAKDEGGLFIS